MALTFGELVNQILMETNRTGNPVFEIEVQNAIVSAIKELEIQQLFLNQKFTQLAVPPSIDRVDLPEDFISVLTINLLDNERNTIFTPATGFRETTIYELETYRSQYNMEYYQQGLPGYWALFNNQIHLYPISTTDGHYLNLWYYYRDGSYPTVPFSEEAAASTSIWLGDFTQDVTRYTARGIFYRDSLQSPELAMSDREKAQEALSRLKLRNSQRETLNNLSY